MRLFFSRRRHDASLPLRLLGTLWFLSILLIGTMASITAHSSHAITPYAVTVASKNFRIPFLTVATDDVSDPGNAQISLQNGSSLWYSITATSTPSGILPVAASTSDIVSTTMLGSIQLLPPPQVLPFDLMNSMYSYEAVHLKMAFTGPGQQVQLDISPFDQHAISLDLLTLLLGLLGEKQNNLQVGLLEPSELQSVLSELSTMRDFTTLQGNYTQILQAQQTDTLTTAYTCARNIEALLNDSSEQSALADVLWHVMGKAIPRDIILKTITSFTQAQFGLAIEAYINNEIGATSGMFSIDGDPSVTLQTISIATPSVTPSMSTTPSKTPSSTVSPIVSPTSSPTSTATQGASQPTATPTSVNARSVQPIVSPTASPSPTSTVQQ